MSSSSKAAALFLLCAAPLAAQTRTPSARAARALALRDSLLAVDAAARGATVESARRGRSGPVLVLLRGEDPQATADAMASIVWRGFREFGAIPDSQLAAIALVDDVVSRPGETVDGRKAVTYARPGGALDSPLWGRTPAEILADNALWNASEGLLLDSMVRTWLERRLDPRIDSQANAAVVQELAIGQWTATRDCLAGVTGACSLYLGIDSLEDARARFPAADIRATMSRLVESSGLMPRGGVIRRCLEGDDEACFEFQTPTIAPSGAGARRSLVHFVRQQYGVEATKVLLRGPETTLWERIRRGTGKSPDTVAAEWREWVLHTGTRQRVEAGMRWIVAAVAAAAALTALASKSGRWRL